VRFSTRIICLGTQPVECRVTASPIYADSAAASVQHTSSVSSKSFSRSDHRHWVRRQYSAVGNILCRPCGQGGPKQ